MKPESQGGFLPLNQGLDFLSGARLVLASGGLQRHPAAKVPSEAEPYRGRAVGGRLASLVKPSVEATPWSFPALSMPLVSIDEFEPPSVVGAGTSGRTRYAVVGPRPFYAASNESLVWTLSPNSPPISTRIVALALLYPSEGETPLSANLCDALLKMQPMGERSRLTLSATWSRSLRRRRERPGPHRSSTCGSNTFP